MGCATLLIAVSRFLLASKYTMPHASAVSSHSASKSSLESLQSFIASDLARVDEAIMARVGARAALIPDMAAHLVHSGGKRLRPSLTLICARLCGYQGERHVHLAAAVEFLHSATLLHDDVVDESALRRGVPTANNIWGNKASILVGDFLLGQAFMLMVGDGSLEVLRILSSASAIIAEGEVMQMVATSDLGTSEDDYIRIISAKTAQLFSAACEIGAVVSDRPQAEQKALFDFGMNLGIAFQIADDALDYSAKQEELGKSIGDDFHEGKVTLPVIHAYANGTAEERLFWKRVIEEKSQKDSDLEKAKELIQKHQSLRYTMDRAVEFVENAKQALNLFPASQEKDILLELLDFSVNRPY